MKKNENSKRTESAKVTNSKSVELAKSAKEAKDLKPLIEIEKIVHDVNTLFSSEMSEIELDLKDINRSTIDIVFRKFKYHLNMMQRFNNLKEFHNKFKEEHNDLFEVYTSDGEFKANLCRPKTKRDKDSNEVLLLGFYDFLAYEGRLIVGQSQVWKYQRTFKYFNIIKDLQAEDVLILGFDNINTIDSTFSKLKKEFDFEKAKLDDSKALIDSKIKEIKHMNPEDEKKARKERRIIETFLNEKKSFNVSFFLSSYKSRENAIVTLMNILVQKYGNKLSTSNIKAIKEGFKTEETAKVVKS